MEEEEENNHITRTVVAVNFQQIMNEVKATTKSAFSCINDNQVLYQGPRR